MIYEQARSQISNGDFIFFKGNDTIVGKMINVFGEGPYVHCAIAFKLKPDGLNDVERLFMVEQYMFGRRITNLSSFSKRQFDVIKSPISWDLYGGELIQNAGKIQYAIMDYLTIYMNEKFGIKIKNFNGQVCSEMLADILKRYNIARDLRVSPTGIVNELLAKGYKISLKVNQ